MYKKILSVMLLLVTTDITNITERSAVPILSLNKDIMNADSVSQTLAKDLV